MRRCCDGGIVHRVLATRRAGMVRRLRPAAALTQAVGDEALAELDVRVPRAMYLSVNLTQKGRLLL